MPRQVYFSVVIPTVNDFNYIMHDINKNYVSLSNLIIAIFMYLMFSVWQKDPILGSSSFYRNSLCSDAQVFGSEIKWIHDSAL